MNFSIDSGSIQRAMKALSVVARANAADATGRVLIEASDSGVLFVANNGYTALSFKIEDVEIKVPGVTAVVYSKLRSFVSSFKVWDEEVGVKDFDFELSDKNLKVVVNNFYSKDKSSRGELVLTTFNPALISRVPEFEEVSFTLNSTIFRAATDKVLYAINPQTDQDQPALRGMNIQFEDENIYFAGSDGVVLSEYQVKNSSDRVEGNITIQYDFVMGLRRLIYDDIVLMWELSGNRVSVKFNEVVYTGRIIIGHEFPNYKPALEDYTDHINLSKEFLTGALHPFGDVLDPEDHFRITFEIRDKLLRIFNVQAKVEAEQDIMGGLDFSIDLNGKHMIQTIDAIKDDNILFKFSDSTGFAIFDSSTFNDQKALISPIQKR
jgi:DNA polymerase III sliding clamp (beta) subunit (PCNA family)